MTILFVISVIYILYYLIKEALEPVVPAENWNNMKAIQEDRLKGLSEKQIHRNLVNGKYK